jgi:PAS domain S-box-containing protein
MQILGKILLSAALECTNKHYEQVRDMVCIGMIRVLYIDDEYLLLDLVKDSLSVPNELTVETAISPQEGLSMLREGGYDAIISDYQIPQMTGIQLLAKLRSEGCDLPFILFTGRGREEVVIEAYRLGADGYVQKGGDAASQFTELEQVLRRAISKHRAVKASVESEEKFRGIFDSAGDSFFVNALDGRFLEVNEAACAFLGRRKQDLLTLSIDDINSDELRATRQHWDWLQPHAPPVVVEIAHSTPAGPVPMELSISSISLGGRRAVLSIARDISGRRAVERSLAESERQLAALMSNLPGMAYRCRNDADWTMEFVSDGCLELTGFRPEQLLNNRDLSYDDLILPEDRDIVWKGVQDGVQKEGPYRLTYRIRTAEGRTKWVWEQGRRESSPIHENGVLEGLIVDISDRMEALEELRTSRLRLELALDVARVVYWEYDPEADQFVLDDHFYSMYGTDSAHEGTRISPDEYLKRFVHPEDWQKVEPILKMRKELIQKDTRITVEHRVIRRGGQIRHILVRTSTVYEGAGRRRVMGANQDITELKMAEEGMRAANTKLGLLSSVTRHDISNQLMVMEGNIRLMRKGGLDPHQAERLEKLQTSVRTINHQINFTKEYQEMGSAAPSWQEVRDAVMSLPEAVEVSSLRISPDVGRLSVYADPMFPKVFRNLLENSLRYAYRPASVRISCAESGKELLLVFEDDGPGVERSEKELIFEKGHGRGTGLGLFLSREILAITGITILENGEQGKGARFEMRVPQQCYRFSAE